MNGIVGSLRCCIVVAVLAALGIVLPGNIARAYPDRPVRIVVPFAPGGATDAIARLIALRMSDRLGQRFFVENIPGAGGRTGTQAAARATPDGYTILVVGSGFVVNPALNAVLPYDPIKDFAPVTVVASSPNVVVVNPSVPARTLATLAAAVRAAPGRYSFASPGAGTLPHLVGELFKLNYDLDIVHVPFNGAGPAIVATIAGHTPIAVVPVPEAAPHIRDRTLIGLAVTATTPSDVMPGVPTAAAAGAPALESETIQAVLVPAATPAAVVDRLHRELADLIRQPETAEWLAAIGFVPVGNTPEAFRAQIDAEIAKWTATARKAKLRTE
jgi:tripartite-type tricarboxylate transporter receptor subunit TctC